VSESLVAPVRTRAEVLGAASQARALAALAGAGRSEQLALVVAELGGNAVRHAGGGTVRVEVGPAGWVVEVEDEGPGLSAAVLQDSGRSDRLGAEGVRPPGDGRRSFGSGLASVRRLATRLELENRRGGGTRVVARCDTRSTHPEAES